MLEPPESKEGCGRFRGKAVNSCSLHAPREDGGASVESAWSIDQLLEPDVFPLPQFLTRSVRTRQQSRNERRLTAQKLSSASWSS